MSSIYVGTCGFQIIRQRYYSMFRVVELQETFYDLPPPERIRRLRDEAPEGFDFTVKVFQAITHPKSSPTWRRMRTRLEGNIDNYGYLRPTRENLNMWDRFLELTRCLSPRVYVFQAPPSLPASAESARFIVDFFKSIESKNLTLGLELRGAWSREENRELLLKIFSSVNLIHVVDPIKRPPCRLTEIMYFRLHGIGPHDVNYRYEYTDSDLDKLLRICVETLRTSSKIYVMFNNIHMTRDALRFASKVRAVAASR